MTERARSLRLNMTNAEKLLWQRLRQDHAGVRVRRQTVIHQRYILDFYVPELKLAIEVDGGQHAENPADATRDAYLVEHGLTVLRFWNNEVLDNIEGVWTRIVETIDQLGGASPLSPLRGRRGEAPDQTARHQTDVRTRT